MNKAYASWDDAPMYIGINKVAMNLDVHPNTVRNLIKKGELTTVRIGEHNKVTRDSIKRYLGV